MQYIFRYPPDYNEYLENHVAQLDAEVFHKLSSLDATNWPISYTEPVFL